MESDEFLDFGKFKIQDAAPLPARSPYSCICCFSSQRMIGRQHSRLLVGLTSMPEPTNFMATGRIMVSPVNHAALRVPFIHTIKRNGISRFQRRNSRRQVNVVSNE